MYEINAIEVYLSGVVIMALGFIFGFIVSRSRYKDRYIEDIKIFKSTIDVKDKEIEKLKTTKDRDIAHAITKEWNRGYDAAFNKLKNEFRYIEQWEKEHGITSGELETFADDFNFNETKNEEEK